MKSSLVVLLAFFAALFFWPMPLSHSAQMQRLEGGDGILALHNLHLHESLLLQYKKGGFFDKKALRQIDQTLRCRQTHQVHEISRELVELVDRIQDHFGGKEVQVISGYRSPALNAALKKAGHKVANRSLHMQGMAMDIRIPGVTPRQLQQYALSLKKGGVGFYPHNGFVHVDVGRVRQW